MRSAAAVASACSAARRRAPRVCQIEIGGIEEVELPTVLPAGRQHRLHRLAVLLLQPVQEMPAPLDLGQPPRLFLDPLGVVAGLSGQLLDGGVGRVEQRPPLRHRPGIEPLQLAQRPLGFAQRRPDAGILAVEGGLDPLGLAAQLAGMGEAVELLIHPLVLAGHQASRVDLLGHVAEVVGPAPDLVPLLEQEPLLPDQGFERVEPLPDQLRLDAGTGKGVEELALDVGVEQGDRLMLTVEIGEGAAQLIERRDGGGAAVDPGPGAPLGRDLPANHHPVVQGVEAERLQHPSEALGRGLEHPLDDRPAGAGPDGAAVHPAAEEQRQGVDQHRLPRPGLAGEHVQAGAELEGHVGDGHQVAHPELDDHGSDSRSRSERSPQRRLSRIRAK